MGALGWLRDMFPELAMDYGMDGARMNAKFPC